MSGAMSLSLWIGIGVFTHMAAVASACVLIAWAWRRREQFGVAGPALAIALALTALWAAVRAVSGPASAPGDFAEAARNLAWLFAICCLFETDGRLRSVRPVRVLAAALALVELLQIALLVIVQRSGEQSIDVAVFHIAVLFRLMFTVGALVLVHNLYAGSARYARLALRWPAAALAVLWLYDLNFYTTAYLIDALPVQLTALRGLAAVAAIGVLALGARKDSARLRLEPSRTLAFQTASLVVIAGYLATMMLVARALASAGGDFAGLLQLGVVVCGSALAAVLLPSRRLRGWLRVTLAKHLFQHRYDYRAEWLRFTRTIGHGGEGASPLPERVVQALADIAESPSGLLLMPGEDGELLLAARWLWPTADVPAPAMDRGAADFLLRENFIVDLDDLRGGSTGKSDLVAMPTWLLGEPLAWALVPLIHYERLIGLVVLARPVQPRKLDWEDFDLLRVVGQQLASYLAESAGQEALAEAARFDDFHRRIAFVMHDIKNLASQMGLLARNAKLHVENPEFRADMLVTLRNSADKLNALLARLSRYGAGGAEPVREFGLGEIAAAVVARYSATHQVQLTQNDACRVTGNPDAFEQALAHLVQNAIDAGSEKSPVFLRVASDGPFGTVEVVDAGKGMSADFIRAKLFKPFLSSKPGGFGIGAYEARELLRSMGGRIDVESREGLGTRFFLRLPLTAASDLLHGLGRNPINGNRPNNRNRKVA